MQRWKRWSWRTNLRVEELAGYDLEIEAWDGEEQSFRARQALTKPTARFEGLINFTELRTTLWRDGKLLHQSQSDSVRRAGIIEANLVVGQRNETNYTYSEGPTRVGTYEEPLWLRRSGTGGLSRERAH